MFEPKTHPRLFGLPPGVDFPKALVQGLIQRNSAKTPEYLARVEVYVNTRRMQRRMREIFDAGGACLLPKISLITDLGQGAAMAGLPVAVPPLRRRLELTQLVGELLRLQPDLAPRTALFDLADSLANLMDEMQSEGVAPDVLKALDVSDQSGHWARALEFVNIIQRYFGAAGGAAPDAEARQRLVVERMIKDWQITPPNHPVIIAGSTGSRGATHLLMSAVARLPQGAVVLPGYDFDLPDDVWATMGDALTAADHPQFRFRKLLETLEMQPADITRWTDDTTPNEARNRLISLALRPAPVTDQWQTEGKKLQDLGAATAHLALIEAPSPRIEALAIALKLRECAGQGKAAALITPDRMLTRRVTAALDQWGIEPDDSAGLPLALSAPGRLLLQITGLFGQKLTAEALLALLKHPLAHTGGAGRGDHLRWTRDLELHLRKYGPPFPTKASLAAWAATQTQDGREIWAEWLGGLLDGLENITNRPLSEHLEQHIALARAFSAGPSDGGSGALWEKPAGIMARETVEGLMAEAEHGGSLSPFDYSNLFRRVLDQGEVHDPTRPHPGIMIWGTLEARVQGVDLVILGGLNDGIWPGTPTPDPWMNRAMRLQAGLLLPERQIGLSAHDFQQAVCTTEVWLSRAVRDSEALTVPSRWLNRLGNLLGGLEKTGGKAALEAIKKRGDALLGMVALLEKTDTVKAQLRPSPRPPVTARPRQLSVTRIKKLIRDPYAIYGEYILRLKPLRPIRQLPDAPLSGIILHRIFERFVKERGAENHIDAKLRLLSIADEVLTTDAPWPTAQRIWRAKIARVADWFLEGEDQRATLANPFAFEETGVAKITALDFTLTAKADRLDRSPDAQVYVYDYKTGPPPTADQQKYFDKQLLLTAAMIERGAFKGLEDCSVAQAAFIGLGSNPKIVPAPLEDDSYGYVWAELETLIAAYQSTNQGYTSRRAVFKERFEGNYDHLARFGEWDESADPVAEDLQ